MNTPSHFLMTAAARKALPGYRIPRSAAFLGSVMPDLPLYTLFVLGVLWFRTVQGMEIEAVWERMWSAGGLYFNNPWWKGLHSFFHAPLVILVGLALARLARNSYPEITRWLVWFWVACAFHSLIDVSTHHDDGPLLFWPFNWEYRFSSPVSYWDPAHYGRPFAAFEWTLALVLTGYLVVPWLKERLAK